MDVTVYQAYLKTAYEALPDVYSYALAYCGKTELDTLRWLSSQPTGGIYKNILHGFSFSVKPGDY